MDFYYQIFSANIDYDNIVAKIEKAGIQIMEMNLGYLRKFFIIPFHVDDLIDFDRVVSKIFGDVVVKYLLFAHIDFRRIIEASDKLDINILDINISHLSGEIEKKCEDEIKGFMNCKDSVAILKSIHDNAVLIKNISFAFHNTNCIKLYGSGVICADTNLFESTELQKLVIEILKITKGVFDDD